MLLPLLLILAGCALLGLGAELLVRGASRIAALAGLSPLVIGLTVVAYGTSAPELVVSLKALFEEGGGLALGNIVGSNIFNVLFVLGICALIAPLVVTRELIQRDVPIMVGASFLVLFLGRDGVFSRTEGLLLVGLAVVYTLWAVRAGRLDATSGPGDGAPGGEGTSQRRGVVWGTCALLILCGLALLVVGARVLVSGAVDVARLFGLSELVIGLTVVAVGTSMPEVATSIVAAVRGERNLAVGNAIGSNIGNLLLVLGLSAALAPRGVPVAQGALDFDLPVMTAVAVACLPIFFTGNRISRWEGGVFLAYYAAYTAYLLLRAAEHDQLPLFSKVMLLFVVPLTVLTLALLAWRSLRGAPR